MFSDFEDWSRHETWAKWTEFRCEFCRREPFRCAERLEDHLKKDHEDECRDLLLADIVSDAKRIIREIKWSACPFCDPTEKDGDAVVHRRVFIAHVARHMEDLTFSSLRPVL